MNEMKGILRMMVQAIDAKEQFEKAADESKPDEEIRKALKEYSDEMEKIFGDSPNRSVMREIMAEGDPKSWEYGYNDIQEKLNDLNREIEQKMMDLQVDMIKGRKPKMRLEELVDIASKVCGCVQYVSFMLECIHGPIMEYVKKHE